MSPRGDDADGVEVELRDESWVGIRPIRADDKEALLAGFQRLSADSRYRRFLTPMPSLSAPHLRYLTEVDHHDHEALIAFDLGTRMAVGVGRYVREGPGSGDAEAAVTVVDDWQGRGLGTALTRVLAGRAAEEGIDCFTALLLADNKQMVGLLDSIGAVEVTGEEGDAIQVRVPIAEELSRDPALRSVLRTVAASGELARPPGSADAGSEEAG